MTKTLKRTALAATILALCALAAAAQEPAPPGEAWVAVAPAGEAFTVRMPAPPARVEEAVAGRELKASGRRYTAAAAGGPVFHVWVLKGDHAGTPLAAQPPAPLAGRASHLDGVAEAAWELLLTPELERLMRERGDLRLVDDLKLGMTYSGDFEVSGRPAREYSVRRERERGLVYVSADAAHAYVVAALGAEADQPRLKQFLDSFAFKGGEPVPSLGPGAGAGVGTGTGGGLGPGRGTNAGAAAPGGGGSGVGSGSGSWRGAGSVDDTRPLQAGQVTKKAAVISKPSPGFTEAARRFNVTGAVRLRAVFAADGEVKHLALVKGLPHGLSAKAIEAARQIKFRPAEKDGRAVSQHVMLEYNFNIY